MTLIELLVVVAIVAVLTSLLIPALRSAMASARTVHCMSNLHQQGQSWSIYAEDYAGTYIAPWDFYATSRLKGGALVWEFWPNIQYQWPYIMAAYEVLGQPFRWDLFQSVAGQKRNPTLFCPELWNRVEAGERELAWWRDSAVESKLTTYSYAVVARDDFGSYSVAGYPRSSRMARPAELFHLTDMASENPSQQFLNCILFYGAPTGHFRTKPHPGSSANYSFYDGHVAGMFPMDETPANFHEDGTP